MKLALIGASGYVGSSILNEALGRGHTVTAIVRHPEKLESQNNLTLMQGDIFDAKRLAQLIASHDVVISAFNAFQLGVENSTAFQAQQDGTLALIQAIKTSGVKRLLIVGGAGSLEVAPGKLLVESPDFPQQWKDMALAMGKVLEILKNQHEINWTLLSPSALLKPGTRTGQFKLGKDQLIVDENGDSKISVEDYAVAMVDEIEAPQHINERFTVGY